MLTSSELAPVLAPAAGLFDQNDPATLGLPLMNCERVVVHRADASGWSFSHIPNLGVYQDRLFLMWNNGQRDEDVAGQRILYCTSDDGANWSPAKVLLLPEAIPGFREPGLLSPGWGEKDGELIAFVTAYDGNTLGDSTSLWMLRSKDGGNWSAPEYQVSGLFMEAPKRVGNGGILLGQTPGADRLSRFYYRDSVAEPWRQATVEGEPKPGSWPEPSSFVRPDGSLVATIRTCSLGRYLYAVESTDGGRHWRGGPTEFSDSGARTSAGNLPDGRCYVISNPSNLAGNRQVLAISLSRDGRRFDRAYALLNNPPPLEFPGAAKFAGWQYPTSLVWKDHLVVAYSISKEHIGVLRCPLSALAE